MNDADAKTPVGFGPDDLESHAAFVRSLAQALLQKADADDIAQDAMLASLAHGGVRSRGWFAVVVRRLAGRWRRAERRRRAREERAARPESVMRAATFGAEAEMLRRLAAAVCALPTPMRDLVLAVYLHGRRPSELAAAEGTPAATVRSRLKRAIDRLRSDLDEHPGRARWEAALAPFAAPSASLVPILGFGLLVVAVIALFVVRGCDAATTDQEVRNVETTTAEASNQRSDRPEPRRAPAQASALPPTEGAASRPVDIPLESLPTGDLVVTVVRARDKAPLAGIDLRIEDPADPEARVRGRAQASDGEGCIRFLGLRPGRVWAISNRGPGIQVRIEPGVTTRETLEIEARYAFRGVVVDPAGRPIAGADVLLGHARDRDWWAKAAQSDAAGRFSLAALDVHQNIAVAADGFRPSRILIPDRRQGEGREPGESVFVLERGSASLSGTVLDRDGKRLAGVEVRIGAEAALPSFDAEGRALETLGTAHFVTDAEGGFRSERLLPGSHPIAARSPSFGLHRGAVELESGAARHIEIVMQPEAVVFGRATFESGDPAADRFVAVRGEDAFQTPFAPTDRSGRFLLRGLPSGKSTLIVQASDGATARTTIDARPGDRIEWNPILATGLSVTGVVVDDDGRAQESVLVRLVPSGGIDRSTADLLSRDAVADSRGAFRFNGLQDRRYDLFAYRARGAMPSARAAGLRPTVADLRVVCSGSARTGTLSGVVLSRDRSPVGGAHLRIVDDIPDLDFATETSPDGHFRFEGIAPGVSALIVQTADRPGIVVSFGALRAGEDRELESIVLAAPAFVELQFADGAARDRALGHVEIKEGNGEAIWVKRRLTASSVVFGPLNPGEIRLGLGSSAESMRVVVLELAEGATSIVEGAQFLR